MKKIFLLPLLLVSFLASAAAFADDCPANWGTSYINSQTRKDEVARLKTLSNHDLEMDLISLQETDQRSCGDQIYALVMSWIEGDSMENHESCVCVRLAYSFYDAVTEISSRK